MRKIILSVLSLTAIIALSACAADRLAPSGSETEATPEILAEPAATETPVLGEPEAPEAAAEEAPAEEAAPEVPAAEEADETEAEAPAAGESAPVTE